MVSFESSQLLYTSVITSEQITSDQEQCDTKTKVIIFYFFIVLHHCRKAVRQALVLFVVI